MTQAERIAALEGEVAELRKQLSALSVAIVELAAKQPVQFMPYYVAPITSPPSWPQWRQPTITYTTSGDTLGGSTPSALS